MAKTKDQKKEAVAKLEQTFKSAPTTVFVHFKGVPVSEETKIRRTLRGEGLGYAVTKKSLVRIALGNLGMTKDLPIDGELAIAYNTTPDGDPVAPASRVHAFGRELKEERFSIVGGIFEGKVVDSATMRSIATIPPVPVLRGMFVNVINSPIAGFVRALDAVAKKRESVTN